MDTNTTQSLPFQEANAKGPALFSLLFHRSLKSLPKPLADFALNLELHNGNGVTKIGIEGPCDCLFFWASAPNWEIGRSAEWEEGKFRLQRLDPSKEEGRLPTYPTSGEVQKLFDAFLSTANRNPAPHEEPLSAAPTPSAPAQGNGGGGEGEIPSGVLKALNNPFHPEALPEELKAFGRNFTLWAATPRPEKGNPDHLGKPPVRYIPETGSVVFSQCANTPPHRVDFVTALAQLEKTRGRRVFPEGARAWVTGMGVVLSKELRLVGVDIDRCLDERGNVLPHAQRVYEAIVKAGTYCEVSPSGRGLRAFVRGTLPEGADNSEGNFEIYDNGRFLTLTGKPFQSAPKAICGEEEGRPVIEAMLAEIRGAKAAKARNGGGEKREKPATGNLISAAPLPNSKRTPEEERKYLAKMLNEHVEEYARTREETHDRHNTLFGDVAFCANYAPTYPKIINYDVVWQAFLQADAGGPRLIDAKDEQGNLTHEFEKTFDDAWKEGLTTPKAIPDKTGKATATAPLPPPPPPSTPFTLSADTVDLEPYPVEAFGSFAEAMGAVAEGVQAPIELVCNTGLALMACAAQYICNVQTRAGGGMPLSLYTLSFAESAEGKTSAEEELMRGGVRAWEKKKLKKYEEDLEAYKRDYEEYLIDLRDWKAKKKQGQEDARPEEPTPPLTQHISITDLTVQGLAYTLRKNQKSVMVLNSDAGTIFGGYSFNEEQREQASAFYCAFFSGSSAKIVRAKDGGEVQTIEGARLSLGLAIQPHYLRGILTSQLCASGFLPRFLPVAPKSLKGNRKWFFEDQIDFTKLEEFWETSVTLLRQGDTEQEKGLDSLPSIYLDAEAKEFFKGCHDFLQKGIREKLFEGMEAFADRTMEQAARIAAIFTLWEGKSFWKEDGRGGFIPRQVNKGAMERGWRLAFWYLRCWLKLKADGIKDLVQKDAQAIMGKIYEQKFWTEHVHRISEKDLRLYVTTRDIRLFGPLQGKNNTGRLFEALNYLIEQGDLEPTGVMKDGHASRYIIHRDSPE